MWGNTIEEPREEMTTVDQPASGGNNHSRGRDHDGAEDSPGVAAGRETFSGTGRAGDPQNAGRAGDLSGLS